MPWDKLRMRVGLFSFWNALKDTLWPPLCLMCRAMVKGEVGLCTECWGKVPWIGRQRCVQCGYPLPLLVGSQDMLCGPCFQKKPLFDRGRSVFLYTPFTAPLVLGLKHQDRTHTASTLGTWMARVAQDLCTPDTWIVPVPLHWTRLLKRSYNQAALLGISLRKYLAIPQHPVLKRTRATPPQGHKTKRQRWTNVRGAFKVRSSYQKRLQGRPVLLIDDVWTTGATLQACARVLKAGGASKVHVVTLARVSLES